MFRPFLVKEQKLLLMAAESKERTDIMNAMMDCLDACVTGVNVRKLPVFDLIYLFLKVRAKSVGEIVDLVYRCEHKDEEKVCGTEVNFTVNLDELNITVPSGHSQVIKLTDEIGIKMKYPTFENSDQFENISSPVDQILAISECIESVYTPDDVIEVSDLDDGELLNFLDSLTQDQLKMIVSFFESMPTVLYETTITCPKCGTPRKITLNELESFF
jgi:hypothetical protein